MLFHAGNIKQDSRQIKNTDKMIQKLNPEKTNNTKHTKTTWFSRLLWHSARKQGGLFCNASVRTIM